MKELVSVIVPIYNVEDYLEKCIQSIQKQTYENLEIILVDDGATDRCGELCDEYARYDGRIRVVHKVNGGLSDARNAGIDIATGKYFVFIDSDDYIHPQMIELLYGSIKDQDAQIAVCGFQSVKENEHVEQEKLKDVTTVLIEKEEDRLEYFMEKNYGEFTVAWNKMYPAELFKEIRYPKGKIHEDEFTTYRLLEKVKRVAFIEEPLYYYVQRGSSIMGEAFNERRFHRLDAYNIRLDYYWQQKKYVWYEKILFLYRIFLNRYTEEVMDRPDMDNHILDSYQRNYRQNVLKALWILPVNIKRKCGYLVSALMPKVYRNR